MYNHNMPTLENNNDILTLFFNLSDEAKQVFRLVAEKPNLIKSEIMEEMDYSDMIAFRALTELLSTLLFSFKLGRGNSKEYYLSENGKRLIEELQKRKSGKE